MRILLFLTACIICMEGFSQQVNSRIATRISQPLVLDGVLDEEVWNTAQDIGPFTQSRPESGIAPSQATKVKILYNNNALYIGAFMYDTAADSVLAQLGRRDEVNLNADDFYIKIDPYANNQDAYVFGVNAAGVQFDSKISDETFDAVWNSAVNITPEGWVAEIEIPYSAIRFPKSDVHVWGLQCTRYIRRNRELNHWSLVPLTATNEQLYWGRLTGLQNIKSPLRLSFTPYLASTFNRQPVISSAGKNEYQNYFSYSAGADIKYGIDNRFTLDMILLPDFGQVQSDKKIKNLSYTEVVFDENRPFFKEAVELFSKGNLFYSRRIGREPSGFHQVYDLAGEEETVTKNPSQVKLINAFKLSGRTDNGLGIGVLNAITNHTYAEISSNGTARRVLTEPLTNYNIVVLDQQLKNNSSYYVINTHTNRDKGYDDANVTGTGFNFSNKKNTFYISGDAALSQRFSKTEQKNTFTNTVGYKYALGAGKNGGWMQYGATREEVNNEFNTTDLGYFIVPGYVRYGTFLNIQQYEKKWFIRESFHDVNAYMFTNFVTGDIRSGEISFNSFFNMLDYNAFFLGGGIAPYKSYDYLEARTEGRKFRTLKYYYYYGGISTDYRKKLAVDVTLTHARNFGEFTRLPFYEGNVQFRIRINDHMFIKTFSEYTVDHASIGFAFRESETTPVFGLRRLDTYENQLGIDYIFKNDMLLNISGRHYWITGKYNKFYHLMLNGELSQRDYLVPDHDFSSNFFNIDMLFEWRFTRGSLLHIIYKNAIEHEQVLATRKFGRNLDSLFHVPQNNLLSLKVIYYLDYLSLKK